MAVPNSTHAGQLLAHLDEVVRAALAKGANLDATLEALWNRCRAAWPALTVPAEEFWAFVAPRLPREGTVAALASIHAEDLFLACACLRRDPGALSAFRERYTAGVQRVLARLDIGSLAVDDAGQALEMALLVGERPGLSLYAGRSELLAWVRSAAIRVAMRLERKARAERPLPGGGSGELGVLRELPIEPPDPELAYLHATHREQFADAFRDALASLSARDRNLLKQAYRHGSSVDDLGVLYRVHRATAARWLARARSEFVDAVRWSLLERLRVGPSTLRSLARALQGELGADLARLL